MVSEQETNKKPPMEVSHIRTLELLIETISNLIDLYITNTNQSQNFYTLAATTQANSQRSTASNINPTYTQKKTYASALIDGGERICGDLAPLVVAAPVTEAGENKEEWMAAVIGNRSAAPPVTDNNVSGGGGRRSSGEAASAATAAAASVAEAVQRERIKKQMRHEIRACGEDQTTTTGTSFSAVTDSGDPPPSSGGHKFKEMGETAEIIFGGTFVGFSKKILREAPPTFKKSLERLNK